MTKINVVFNFTTVTYFRNTRFILLGSKLGIEHKKSILVNLGHSPAGGELELVSSPMPDSEDDSDSSFFVTDGSTGDSTIIPD